jgi:carbonic anhydrase
MKKGSVFMFVDKILNHQQIGNKSVTIELHNRKKALFIIGIEGQLEQWLYSEINIPTDQILVLKSNGPVISEPFDCLMRSIIVAVYQEKVEEIFIIGSIDSDESIVDPSNLLAKMKQKGITSFNIQIEEYLFKHCFPGFRANDLSRWVERSKTVIDGVKQSVDLIQRHPLIHSGVRVHGLLIDTVNNKITRVVAQQ